MSGRVAPGLLFFKYSLAADDGADDVRFHHDIRMLRHDPLSARRGADGSFLVQEKSLGGIDTVDPSKAKF
jgi:hypothetical protein